MSGQQKIAVLDREDIWTALAAPIPAGEVQWRQNGRPKARDGKYFAPFVAYIDAQFVRDRFDDVVPGEWDLTLELLPALLATGGDGEANDQPCAFKARLQVLGVIREDVGAGHDYKQASTDAFKRAAVRFGVGRELYTDYEIVWVQVDSDGKYAKPLEDPAVVFARKRGKPVVVSGATGERQRESVAAPADSDREEPTERREAAAPNPAPLALDEQSCPKCGGRCFDNRAENDARAARGEKMRPDFKCRDRSCDGVIWRPKEAKTTKQSQPRDDEIPF